MLAFNGIHVPGVAADPVLRDDTPDPGLFGPHSTAWRLLKEPVLLLGGQRALLMQLADPLVAQAVIEHSDYREDPYGRLLRTLRWIVSVTFGTRQEAAMATEAVAAVHRNVRGRLPADRVAAPYTAGAAYRAADPTLARWVLATVIHSSLVTYESVVRPVPGDDRDAYTREWLPVAGLFGIPDELCWADWASLETYVDAYVADLGGLGVGAREAAEVVFHPPASLLAPVLAATTFMSVGLLPPRLRQGYGVRWTQLHHRAHQAGCVSLRAAHHVFPRRLRNSPFYLQAQARIAAGRRNGSAP